MEPKPSTPDEYLIDDYSLLALNKLIRKNPPTWEFLAFQNDIFNLGVNLAYKGFLSRTLFSPWTLRERLSKKKKEPDFISPPSYNKIMLPHLGGYRFRFFNEGILFYILFNAPSETVRFEISSELCSRGWIFHFNLGLWVKICSSNHMEARIQNKGYEYLAFDMEEWKLGRVVTKYMF
ncbi:hypothetical protein F4703DRAFT_1920061 [Phycomyces blakesleeanus]|uniref:NOT2/NOT3/NOT5 C-terminal domain-containing protein n=1 Tax=Phycomyces blakesleeanus (strain ATCC 8743b / DSM 1359 / FGSC 10004 / NBRC 33097 / NRRL 1555) TaxID=763407 RepID=A0A167LJK5_PHYB8|nr:hypothetical protein PHYBLDRAFT_148520 [Phycomyces blakesleeanus NRRL 1555(-)]OAD70599.1 hypothetical protein PHYBLDRAFT_148520 [Phycomyces blakesleeanus NRRL 1555(-)]|eukprot:XP_018288639.1 hypothetical protein PHYBLDRAFT_148520 [Phycomyces blakesleeanus NRRL 1555(-)]